MRPVRTIQQQTGIARRTPVSLYDFEVLKQVTQYSFDTDNRAFLIYFEHRTGCYIGAEANNWQIHEKIAQGFMQPLPDDYVDQQCRVANSRDDNTVNRLFRAKLQDCWELFTQLSSEQRQQRQRDHEAIAARYWAKIAA